MKKITISEPNFNVIDLLHNMEYAAIAFFKQEDTGIQLGRREAEAIIIDFINFIGLCKAVDLAFYTCDLKGTLPLEKDFDFKKLGAEDKATVCGLPEQCLTYYPPQAIRPLAISQNENELEGIVKFSEKDIEKAVETFLTYFKSEKW